MPLVCLVPVEVRGPRTVVLGGQWAPCGCWVRNPGPLQEQPVLLTRATCTQPRLYFSDLLYSIVLDLEALVRLSNPLLAVGVVGVHLPSSCGAVVVGQDLPACWAHIVPMWLHLSSYLVTALGVIMGYSYPFLLYWV